jgi:hypothetical protein
MDMGIIVSKTSLLQTALSLLVSDLDESVGTNMQKTNLPLRRYFRTATLWAAGGSIGGIVIGIVLVAMHGFSIVSLSFWFSVGILIGAVAGFLSFLLYGIGYRILKGRDTPHLLNYSESS